MDDAGAMRLVQRISHLHGDRQRLLERQRARVQSTLERLAVEILHHQEIDALVLADVVAAVQMCGWFRAATACASRSNRWLSPGLAASAAGSTLIATVRFKPRVARLVHLAHAAGAE